MYIEQRTTPIPGPLYYEQCEEKQPVRGVCVNQSQDELFEDHFYIFIICERHFLQLEHLAEDMVQYFELYTMQSRVGDRRNPIREEKR